MCCCWRAAAKATSLADSRHGGGVAQPALGQNTNKGIIWGARHLITKTRPLPISSSPCRSSASGKALHRPFTVVCVIWFRPGCYLICLAQLFGFDSNRASSRSLHLEAGWGVTVQATGFAVFGLVRNACGRPKGTAFVKGMSL